MESSVYFSGIDLHKKSAVIHTVDEQGHRVKQATLPNHPAALAAYFGGPPGRHRAVVEATSGWYWLSDVLRQCDIDLILAHATGLKAICHAKVKTDRVDAAMLAQLLRVDLIPEAYQMEPERRAERDLMRARLRLVQRQTSCQNSVARLLEKFNISDVGSLPALYRQQAEYHQAHGELLDRHIKDIEKTLKARLRRDLPLYRLSFLPGFGDIVAATVLLEIGDINRFQKDRQFFSYARLVPGAANSAKRQRHRSGHKAGNKFMKIAFSHAALRAIQFYPEIREAYKRKRRKKPVMIARAYIAKELARIAYYVLKERKDFDGCFKGVPLKRQKTPSWPRPADPEP